MTHLYRSCRNWCIGTTILLSSMFFMHSAQAQCDFINDITGITQGIPPTGNAANPLLFTHRYVLVDNQGIIVAVNTTPDFVAVPAGNYQIYAVNFAVAETAAVTLLMTAGQPWSALAAYGDNAVNCLDYSAPYGGTCPIVVCDEVRVCEFDAITQTSSGFIVPNNSQTYCLVCNDVVQALDPTGVFDLNTFPAATGGANCQIYGMNYLTSEGAPVAVGGAWSTAVGNMCAGTACFDFIGMNLDISGVSLASSGGLSTTVDWWDLSDGCAGAGTSTNGGGPFNVPANNWCVPPYDQGVLNARPDDRDDLWAMSMGMISRFACTGALDLTQHTVFYTVQCPISPSVLQVNVTNPGGNITGIQAALYGPVNAACPTITGGTFVDCDDSGTGATSGSPLGDLVLTTNGNPGETYLVIVDTEGRDSFQISSNVILLDVNLSSFKGTKLETDNLLEWSTEKEDGLSHFELEYSLDGINFELLRTHAAAGNSNVPQAYQSLDVNPGAGTKYYRLKLVEADGDFEYSNIVALTRNKSDNLGFVNIYPNPSETGLFNVQISADVVTTMHYEVMDVIGQSIYNGNLDVVPGFNEMSLDLKNFPAATYILSMTIDGHRVNRRIVKD